LEFATKGLLIAAENLQAAESRIRDTDMAASMVEYSKNNILIQSATAMLSQANQKNQSVLSLLR
jgi:flagellin